MDIENNNIVLNIVIPPACVVRLDKGSISKPVRLDNGFLKAPAYLTRAGVFKYTLPNGVVRRELRLPEEVFKTDSLDSLSLSPITLEHPPELLNSENAKKYSVGSIGTDIENDNNFVRASLMVTDKEAVEKIDTGSHRELSCGYTCEMVEQAGEWEGQKYDAIQKNIKYNHVALVQLGRAGKDVRIKLDSNDAVINDTGINEIKPKELKEMVKITLDKLDFEVSEQAKQAMENVILEKDITIETMQKKADENQARLDAQEAELKELKNEDRIKAIVSARVRLEKEASKLLEDVKLDEMSNVEIMKTVILKKHPDFKLDDKSEVYIQAQYDYIVNTQEVKNDDLADTREALNKAVIGKNNQDSRQEFMNKSKDLWKQNN